VIALSLSTRLSLAFAALLIASSGAAAWLQVRSNTMHEQELVQRLSSDVAGHIAASAEFMDENGVGPHTRIFFDRLMSVNPSVEVYLLDAAGAIVGHAAPEGHVRRAAVDTAPIERLLGGAPLPILGDDPRSAGGQKVFSASRLELDGRTWGYVYVILMGEARDLLAADVAGSSVLRTTLWSMVVVALLGLLAGLIAVRRITRPLGALTAAMHALDLDRLAATAPPARDEPPHTERDEIAILSNAFGRMAARIADQWRALTRQDQERRELIANVSHDLRTPLTSLHGFLETLARKHDLSETERRRHLETALAQSNKVSRLARELFELARLEHDTAPPEMEPFSLVDLVQDVLQELALLAAAKRQRLTAHIPPGLPNVVACLPLIERVLINLLDNAIRHAPTDGEIRIALRTSTRGVEVTVRDDGPGIPAALRDTLFRRPSVLRGARRGEAGGLGLLIVHRILQLHGSRIELGDGEGGAEFRFELEADRPG
jgi:signal transduction histidine kinase